MKNKVRLYVLLFLFLPLFQVFPGNYDIHISGKFTSYFVREKLLVYSGESRGTNEEILLKYQNGDFVPKDSFRPPLFNRGRLQYWINFTIHNTTDIPQDMYLINFDGRATHKFDLYVLDRSTSAITKKGIVQKDRNLFAFTIGPREKISFFIDFERYRYRTAIRLFSAASYKSRKEGNILFDGFYYGILFVLTLYNLILVFSLKIRSYIFYILFNVTFAFYFFIRQSTLPLPFGFEGVDEVIVISVRNMTGIFLIFFARDFLRSKEFAPVLDKLIKAMLSLAIGATFVFFVMGIKVLFIVHYFFIFVSFSAILLIVLISVMALLKRYHPALFFVLAVCSLIVIQILFSSMIVTSGFLPFSLSDLYNLRLQEASQLVMILLFSLGLADTIRVIRDEKERALEEIIIQTQKSSHIEAERERLKNQLAIAKQIQTVLIPLDFTHDDFEIAAAMLPAAEVGGDYYNLSNGCNDELWVSIGDVSGHGMSSGLIMMIVLTIHSTITSTMRLTPKDAVQTVNRMLMDSISGHLRREYMMSLTSLQYRGEGRFIYSGLHLPLIVYKKEEQTCRLIETEGLYLNLREDISEVTTNNEFSIEPGDLLILYTDGIIESRNEQKQMFDLSGIITVIEQNAHLPVEEIKNILLNQALSWCGNRQGDDMTVIILRRKK